MNQLWKEKKKNIILFLINNIYKIENIINIITYL